MPIHHAEVERQKYGSDSDRTKALSDGVFAFAMTLLVLDLKVPERLAGETDQMFLDLLRDRLPYFVNFAMSFAIIGLYWMAHTMYFKLITKPDRKIVRINLFFLFMVAFFPFPTAVLGTHGFLRSAWIFYSASLILMGLGLKFIISHAIQNNLLKENLSPKFKKYIFWRGLAVPIVFLISIAVAFINLDVAKYLPLTLPIVLRIFAYKFPEPA